MREELYSLPFPINTTVQVLQIISSFPHQMSSHYIASMNGMLRTKTLLNYVYYFCNCPKSRVIYQHWPENRLMREML